MRKLKSSYLYLVLVPMFLSTSLLGQQPNYPCQEPTILVPQSNLCPTTPFKLVYQDEFNGDAIDTDKWHTYYPYGPANNIDGCADCRTRGFEEQNYLDANVRCASGYAYLDVKEVTNTINGLTNNYSSGLIQSKQDFTTYARYEIKCSFPSGEGYWPAFWAFGWSTEIDVFDQTRQTPANKLKGGIIKWDCPNQGNTIHDGFETNINFNPEQNFHVYAADYSPYFVKFYCDNILVGQINRVFNSPSSPVTGCTTTPGIYVQNLAYPSYGDPVNVIANVAVINPSATATFPKSMVIDYIRVYERVVQPDLTDLCAQRNFVGDNVICQNQIKEFKVEGGHGHLDWSTSNNLEIIETGSNYIKVQIKNNANTENGYVYLTETNSPCGSNYNISHEINIGDPMIKSITKNVGGCGDVILIQTQFIAGMINSSQDFNCTINGQIPWIQAFQQNSLFYSAYPPPVNDYCYPVEISATNQCGTTNYNTMVQDNCIPSPPCPLANEVIDFDFAQKVTLFPNPSQNTFTIAFEDRTDFFVQECRVINAVNSNEVLYIPEVNVSENIQVDCSNWPQGIYFVQFVLEDHPTYYKTFLKN